MQMFEMFSHIIIHVESQFKDKSTVLSQSLPFINFKMFCIQNNIELLLETCSIHVYT